MIHYKCSTNLTCVHIGIGDLLLEKLLQNSKKRFFRCVSPYAPHMDSEFVTRLCMVWCWLQTCWRRQVGITDKYSVSQEICTRFYFAVLCCGYTLTDFPISIRLTSLALWQSNDCPSASKATLMNMDKYVMWIHYERLHSHNKAKHNKTVCIFLGVYCRTWLLISRLANITHRTFITVHRSHYSVTCVNVV